MQQNQIKTVALIVAHPNDETLWAGGTVLSNPSWQCHIVCLCRKGDPDRASRFFNALTALGASGVIGEMDDGPDQTPLPAAEIQGRIQRLLPDKAYDLIITHNPNGQLRHEEVSGAVIALWANGSIKTKRLWTFAYEGVQNDYLPTALLNADCWYVLQQVVYDQKCHIITQVYGFEPDSWQRRATPEAEAFWCFANSESAGKWLAQGGLAS